MIGIQAMSVISNLTGHSDDAAKYSSIAHDYISKWQTLGIAQDANPPHATLSYGNDSSHGKPHSNSIPYSNTDLFPFQASFTTSMRTPSWVWA